MSRLVYALCVWIVARRGRKDSGFGKRKEEEEESVIARGGE